MCPLSNFKGLLIESLGIAVLRNIIIGNVVQNTVFLLTYIACKVLWSMEHQCSEGSTVISGITTGTNESR